MLNVEAPDDGEHRAPKRVGLETSVKTEAQLSAQVGVS